MTTQTKLQVSRADFKRVEKCDNNPDLSYLGKYSNTPDRKRGFIDRKERGDMGRGEFKYFNCGCGDPEYIEEDYKRCEAYNRGEWYMIGIKAIVELKIPIGGRNFKLQTIDSGGLWGIESDSGESYLTEEYQNQCAELEIILTAMGIEIVD